MQINRAYKPFLEAFNRFAILYGGAGSGKSHVVAQKILIRISSEKNARILVVRKVARTLRSSVFQMFRDLIAEEELLHKFKINKSDMTIECIDTGSQLLFYGLDDVEKLKSIAGITSVWVEEASEILQDDLDQLNLRLRVLRDDVYMQIILTFNPISAEHWIKKKFFDAGVEDTYIQKTTFKDNRFLPKQYLKVFEDLKETNKTFYKIYALGEWGTLKGLVYENYGTIDNMPKYFEKEYIGLDFGFNHPFSIVHTMIDGTNIYVDEIVYETGWENKKVIEFISNKYSWIKNKKIFADSARPDLINEWKNNGYNIDKANKSVFAGINTVKSFNIFVTSRSTNIIRELNLYSWKDDRDGNTLDEPIKLNDDALDALRYSLTNYIKKAGETKSFRVNLI